MLPMTDTPTPPFPDEPPRLGLPYLLANQAQKHEALYAALSRLDSLAQLCAANRVLSRLPGRVAGGEAWIIGPGPSSALLDRMGDGSSLRRSEAGWRSCWARRR